MKEKIKGNNRESFRKYLKVYRQALKLGISIEDTRKILKENYSCLEKIFLNEPLSIMNAFDKFEKEGIDLTKLDASKKVSDEIFASMYRNYNPLFPDINSPLHYDF